MNFYVRTFAGLEYGPLTSKQLRDAAKIGTLARRDLVRPDGTVDWFRAEKVRGLEFMDSSAVATAPNDQVPDAPTMLPATAPTPPASAPTPPIRPITLPQVSATAEPRKDDGLLRHIEPLALRGFNVRKLDGEEVESVEPQSFLDALRLSMLAAIIGRRGVLVLTNRRVFVTNATISTRALQSAYLDRIDRIGFGSRTAIWKLLLGVILALVGAGIQLAPLLVGWIGGTGFAIPTIQPAALVFVGVGIIMILLARYRALEIGVASGTIVFAKRSLELDTLSRIDEIRERRLGHFKSGATDDAQIS
ncbi:MAG: domain 2 [Planctomycetota bacterium]|jgi:hypothetical protein